jgi:2-haloacid dehalogenase
MARICVFDVNETLLDLQALDPAFEGVFGDAAVRRAWFQQVLQSAMTATLSNHYVDFATIARGSLHMIAERHERSLSDEEYQAILGGIRRLPAHPDVLPALEKLQAAGLRIVALTNSPPATVEAQLQHAGIRDYFETVLTVDLAQRFKPAPEVYQAAAQELGVLPDQLRMIAAHDWDITGALRAGYAGALVMRPGVVLDPNGERPDIVGKDLIEVVEQIIRVEVGE